MRKRWRTQNRGLELALFFTLPATVALVICGVPIITGLFQHGQFGAADAVKTGQALAAFSLGLPSYILVKVLTPGYYARHDTKTPMRYAMISIAINLVLNLALIFPEACRTATCDRGRLDRQRLDALSHAEEARPFRERRAAPAEGPAPRHCRHPHGGRGLLRSADGHSLSQRLASFDRGRAASSSLVARASRFMRSPVS